MYYEMHRDIYDFVAEMIELQKQFFARCDEREMQKMKRLTGGGGGGRMRGYEIEP